MGHSWGALKSIYAVVSNECAESQLHIGIDIKYVLLWCTCRLERLVIVDERVPAFANKEISGCGSQLRQQAEWETVDLGTHGSPGGETREWRLRRQKKRRCKIYLVDCWMHKNKKNLRLPGGRHGSETFQETPAQRTLQTKSQSHRSMQWLSRHAQEPRLVSRPWIQAQGYHGRKKSTVAWQGFTRRCDQGERSPDCESRYGAYHRGDCTWHRGSARRVNQGA